MSYSAKKSYSKSKKISKPIKIFKPKSTHVKKSPPVIKSFYPPLDYSKEEEIRKPAIITDYTANPDKGSIIRTVRCLTESRDLVMLCIYEHIDKYGRFTITSRVVDKIKGRKFSLPYYFKLNMNTTLDGITEQ